MSFIISFLFLCATLIPAVGATMDSSPSSSSSSSTTIIPPSPPIDSATSNASAEPSSSTSSPSSASSSSSSRTRVPTILIDSTGSINRRASSLVAPNKGVVTIITSPGQQSDVGDSLLLQFPVPAGNEGAVTASTYMGDDGPIVIVTPGATLDSVPGGTSSLTAPPPPTTATTTTSTLGRGYGASAAASISGSIIVTGVMYSDVEIGLSDTRFGCTVSAVFESKLRSLQQQQQQQQEEGKGEEKQLLIVTVQGKSDEEEAVEVDANSVKKEIGSMFDAAAVSAEKEGVNMEDFYEVEVVMVQSTDDANKVISMASAAASRSPLAKTGGNVSSAIADAYSKISAALPSSVGFVHTPAIAEAILACDDAYARHARMARAKISYWSSRAKRGLMVERFGANAEALLQRTMEYYDRDTMAAAGFASAAPYRLEMRSKLQGFIEKHLRQLFTVQVTNLEKTTLKKFTNMLLRKQGKSAAGTQEFYNNNAAAMRSAAFAFEQSMNDLEVPSLALTKTKASQDMSGKLNSALIGFPDSPAAQLKSMKEVKKTVSKQRKPTERSIDAGLDLVAMIRPDGFGTFQGFAGYQLGGNSITVGVHNDADAPEVISQFGGVRPPFIRVQPKLRLDVEL